MNASASNILRKEAVFRWPTDYHTTRIYNLATQLLHWGERRVRSIYNREHGVELKGFEIARLAEIEAAQIKREKQAKEVERHATFILERLARLETRLAEIDPDFHQPQMVGIRDAIYRSGHPDGSGPKGGE